MDELYHFTDGASLHNILKSDKFILTDVRYGMGDESINKGYRYYMSLTRTPNSTIGYPSGMLAKDLCKIVIDGHKLNTKFKIGPVNWAGNAKGQAIRASWDEPEKNFDPWKSERMKQTNVEAEDRVFSNKPEIPHFSKYIKRIYINTDTIHPKDAEEIIKYCERLDIHLVICTDTKEFVTAH